MSTTKNRKGGRTRRATVPRLVARLAEGFDVVGPRKAGAAGSPLYRLRKHGRTVGKVLPDRTGDSARLELRADALDGASAAVKRAARNGGRSADARHLNVTVTAEKLELGRRALAAAAAQLGGDAPQGRLRRRGVEPAKKKQRGKSGARARVRTPA